MIQCLGGPVLYRISVKRKRCRQATVEFTPWCGIRAAHGDHDRKAAFNAKLDGAAHSATVAFRLTKAVHDENVRPIFERGVDTFDGFGQCICIEAAAACMFASVDRDLGASTVREISDKRCRTARTWIVRRFFLHEPCNHPTLLREVSREAGENMVYVVAWIKDNTS